MKDSLEAYVVRRRDAYIGCAIYNTGEYEFDKLLVAVRNLPPLHRRKRLIDVGANVGSICIPAVKRSLFSSAVAIEPEKENFRLLRVNAILNDVEERIRLLNAAAGPESQVELVLALDDLNFGDHHVRLQTEVGHVDSTVVCAITLDKVCAPWSQEEDLIWMDVQGFEAEVLTGALKALEAGVPLALEFWPERIVTYRSREQFLSLISSYAAFIDLDKEEDGLQIIEAVKELFDIHLSQGSSTDILLLRQ